MRTNNLNNTMLEWASASSSRIPIFPYLSSAKRNASCLLDHGQFFKRYHVKT